VVGTTSQIDGNALFQRRIARRNRGARRATRSLDHLWRPRKANSALLAGGQFSGDDPFKVAAMMRQQDVGVVRGLGLQQSYRRQFDRDRLAQ
jgi:hypothetical protein